MYGLMCVFGPRSLMDPSPWWHHVLFCAFCGFSISAVISGFILTVGFLRKRGTAFKTLAAVLWPVTLVAGFYAGIFSYIPYQIYNIVKLIILTRAEPDVSSTEPTSDGN